MPHRCYLPELPAVAGAVEISGDEAHHLARVLRCKTGEPIELLDGKGTWAVGEISRIERRNVEVEVGEIRYIDRPANALTLIQAVPKGKRQELVLQKAVELGVHRIVFVQTEHVVSRIKPEECEDKLARWKQVLVAGLKQSGNPWLPEMNMAFDWDIVVKEAVEHHDVVLLADLSPGARPLREVVAAHRSSRSMACCIGPEGDFSARETEAAHAAGCVPVNLGSRVLRTETAALYLMSVYAYEFLN